MTRCVHLLPGLHLVLAGLQGGGDSVGLVLVFEQDEDGAGVVLGLGDGLRFGQRHEDGALVEAGRAGGVDAADDEGLLVHVAVGGVDQQVDAVAGLQAQLVGQRLADQDALAVIGW